MATQPHEPTLPDSVDTGVDADHDAFVRGKVLRGLEQSRDRSAMIPIEQVWRDLSR